MVAGNGVPGRGIRMCKVLYAQKSLMHSWEGGKPGRLECKGVMEEMTRDKILEGGRGQITEQILGHAG